MNSICLELVVGDTKTLLSLIEAACDVTGTHPCFNGASVLVSMLCRKQVGDEMEFVR